VKALTSVALVALLAGCAGGASSVSSPSSRPMTTSAGPRVPHNGGPGTTSITYYDTYAPDGECHPGKLTIMDSLFPVTDLSFAAGDGPPLVLSNCNFTTPQYVNVTLEVESGSPFIRQTDYTVTIDAPAAARAKATWTALGPTLPGTPDHKGKVSFTISDPSGAPGL
jgi:hypothetical protein